jgi:ribosomal-protein-alanine N-acetyltransferase
MPVKPPLPVLIETERLVLRPLQATDASRIALLASDWEMARMTARIPHPYPDGAAEAFIAAAAKADGLVLAIAERRAPALLIGCAGVERWQAGRGGDRERAVGEAELGYWIGRPYWGRGYATEAGRAVLAFAFRHLALERIVVSAMLDNPASHRVIEKLGFRPIHPGRLYSAARGEQVEVHRFALASEAFCDEPKGANAPTP